MATKPQYYPEWALQDTNLPATGQANKVRPKESLRLIGWDKGQIPTAEEFNWTLNNMYQWTQYYDEAITENLDSFLPKQGTKITFQGKAVGEVDFNGNIETNVNLTIADLNDATSSYTPNTLVKRDNEGGFAIGRGIRVYGIGQLPNADYWMADGNGNTKGSLAWVNSGDFVNLYLGDGQNPAISEIRLENNGRAAISEPYSLSTQGTLGSSLTRKDYVDNVVGERIRDLRLNTPVRVGNSGDVYAAAGGVFVMIGDFGADDGYGAYALLQYNKGGSWITVPQL